MDNDRIIKLDEYPYEEKVVCVLDVLGFGKKVCNTRDAEKSEDYTDLRVLMTKISSQVVKANASNKLVAKVFSDSIFVSCYIEDILELLEFISTLIFQVLEYGRSSVLKDGVEANIEYTMLRGGITYGKVYMSVTQPVCFGPAIIDDHELEADIAIFPRIIMSQKLVSVLNECGERKVKCAICDDDELQYFDFISFLNYDEIRMSKEYISSYMYDLKAIVENERKLRVCQKYMWLIKYFEKFV